jgi:hypothetical protein
MWTPAKPCCRRIISSWVAIIDANMQETKQIISQISWAAEWSQLRWFNARQMDGASRTR